MNLNYPKALAAVLKHEGGYVNHPADPGGATNKGITQAVYDAYRKRLGLFSRSVKMIDDAELQAIYRKQYWEMIRGDELPTGIDYAVFDFAVNSGVSRAAKYLQMTLGVKADGIIGQITLKAAEEAEPRIIINEICDRRMDFLMGLSTWRVFGTGWKGRVAGVRALAIDMLSASPVPDEPAKEPARNWLTVLIEVIVSIFRSRK
jgi:lysozyme family protein